MARRKIESPEVKITRWFDHIASELVDVIPNSEGEFVQVWSAPRSRERRYVKLSYQRTPNGPVNIDSHIVIEGEMWKSINTTGPRRTYFYSGETHDYRYEEILPSGRLLVEDQRRGIIIKETWTEEFDWENLKPKGKPLGNRAVQKRQGTGAPYFVTNYQQILANGIVTSEALVCVVEFLGNQFLKTHEFTRDTHIGKEHQQGPSIL